MDGKAKLKFDFHIKNSATATKDTVSICILTFDKLLIVHSIFTFDGKARAEVLYLYLNLKQIIPQIDSRAKTVRKNE